jgi:hypothetical protein
MVMVAVSTSMVTSSLVMVAWLSAALTMISSKIL